MILCSCKNVSDRTVRAAIAQGATTVEAVAEATQAGTECGSCRCDLRCLIDAARVSSTFQLHLCGRPEYEASEEAA